jgi:hypothetical protein
MKHQEAGLVYNKPISNPWTRTETVLRALTPLEKELGTKKIDAVLQPHIR